MDKGRWCLCSNIKGELIGVASDDFDHDVELHVNGDFESPEQRREYCIWLMRTLNESNGEQS